MGKFSRWSDATVTRCSSPLTAMRPWNKCTRSGMVGSTQEAPTQQQGRYGESGVVLKISVTLVALPLGSVYGAENNAPNAFRVSEQLLYSSYQMSVPEHRTRLQGTEVMALLDTLHSSPWPLETDLTSCHCPGRWQTSLGRCKNWGTQRLVKWTIAGQKS